MVHLGVNTVPQESDTHSLSFVGNRLVFKGGTDVSIRTDMTKAMGNSLIRRKTSWRSAWVPILFLLPVILFNVVVVSGPALGTVALSFTNWTGFNVPKFIGFKNYVQLFHDQTFYAAMLNNLQWLAIFCTIPIISALLVAILISKIKRGQTFFRVLFFLPYTLSTVLVSEIWSWIYDPLQGVNTLLQKIGIHHTFYWLGNQHIVLYCIAVAAMWQGWGFILVIFVSALSQLDPSLEEAAKIEGASNIQMLWYITFPQLRPTIILVLMLSVIGSFTVFDFVFIMTQGGPANASQVVATYMYQTALYNQAPAYASSIALMLGLLAFVIIGFFGILRKRGWEI